ncbi:sugar phosphate isomerase/epimerase family protein [Ohessyouella blattaphilus]|uniref:Sugar phosphate isomerase/epimerase n=1 Tax=Ohessyouella blattaphilus TaxID=2949333 RepID=A0ABT1EKD5_9FIRM|nr:sugar phosphate isomerase/epimerase family protein [Ohessyouella blattaphilus]MCP1111158.1 sugar phosphate isomerase/epimerase [Ohessyouella blattaphilus]MCR8564552.1 sugar phosphate isomerase/epimerase [Ohessyouella blattaphilus]
MYKIAGHTMGTPEYNIYEAIELMERIGADGIEIVIQDGYQSGLPCNCSKEELEKVKQYADNHHVQIICLTPYNSYFNSLDESQRRSEIEEIKRIIEYCVYFNAKYIRIYGGNLVAGDTDHYEEKWEALVQSLKELGEAAEDKGVTLVVENHFNTMTVSAKESAALMKDVNHPAVRILYDQANLTFTEQEDYEEAIRIQQQYVGYIHVKDLVFQEGKPFASSDVARPSDDERNVYTRIVGEGVIKWPEILKLIKKQGYEGWLSLEYERRWHPDDIPDASVGMKKSLEYLQSLAI